MAKSNNNTSVKFRIEPGKYLKVLKAQIKVYGLGKSKSSELASFEYAKGQESLELNPKKNTFFLAVAQLDKVQWNGKSIALKGRNIQLIAVFDAASKLVTLSEPSTIACAYNFCRFMSVDDKHNITISASERALNVAYKMKGNFYDTKGEISKVIQSPPNGLQTNSYPMFNFLSNLVYYSIVSKDIYAKYLKLNASGNSFFGALLHMILNPFDNVKSIYKLIKEEKQIYGPSLTDIQMPSTPNKLPKLNQWTLTIKVNDSGAQNFLISGPGYLVFDKNDRAWVSNNLRQGTFNSSTFAFVLEPDGSPAKFSPVFGGGLLGGAFGVTTDAKKEKIYFGNYGWGITDNNPEVGSISVFSHDGTALSPPNGYCNKTNRVQGMSFDSKGNLWMCSWGDQAPMTPFDDDSPYPFANAPSAVVVYLKGNPKKALSFQTNKRHPFFGPFSLAIDSKDNVFVANSGNDVIGSSVYKFRLNKKGTAIEHVAHWDSTWSEKNGYEWFKQININSKDEIFVAGTNSDRIVKLDNDLKELGVYTENIFGPWGVTIDKEDNMYVSNFGPTKTKSLKLGVAIIPAGAPIAGQGKGKIQLMNLPTGGEEVTLANGFPVYGQVVLTKNRRGTRAYKTPKCYEPLMLLTATRIDKAGNLWSLSNFKPSFYVDLLSNPGGDGIVIFIGVAPPE
jgi:hypothetical protein